MLELIVISLLAICPYLEAHESVFKLKPTDKLKDGQKLIQHVNEMPGNTWKAELSFDPETTVRSFIDARLGLMDFHSEKSERENGINTSEEKDSNEVIKSSIADNTTDDLPENYDARKAYPGCISIPSIKDQSNCGSCWAVSIAAALSDRFCIKTQGRLSLNLSANYFTACSKKNYGCQGGYMNLAHIFLQDVGLISGGDFESDEGCQPYEIRPCGFRDTLPCSTSNALTPKCKNTKCTNEYYHTDNEDKFYKALNYTALPKDETAIRKEILKNGPVAAGFVVYTDFMFYKKGVYQRRSWWPQGGHAVRIIGWGVENGVKYWLVANSWSSRWGENGTFRIIRGRNECSFEESVYAAHPLIN